MISFERVSKRYLSGRAAVENISFRATAGDFVLLSGHSGAGKSTLLNLLAVIEHPTEGAIRVNGEDVTRLARRALPYYRRTLGLILQDQKLLSDRSVFDNVQLPLAIAGHSRQDAARRAQAALERVGLAARAADMPITLSGGEQQRVAIARAIVAKPLLLLADEPTASLDPAYARDIAELLASFNRAGVTVLVTSHDTALFEPHCTRRLVLDHGRLMQ
ncbi:MAG: ATP-binding cassette domain-containing protein [Rhodocyclaceae bacterium]|nr:ATP-binding cassette domain-containing protein [Rhodocyclaceae bacterium]MBX3671083.1 ATP-binding cassette domain-containing protein [Rhodocyclaceae bacterium]